MAPEYTTESSKVLLETKTFNVHADIVRLPTGGTMERFVVRHPGAVVILPITSSGTFLAIKQYRHSIGETILEFPAGTLEVGEAPRACAEREIQEETGFAAKQWQELGMLYPAPGFCDEKQYLFLATDLYPQRLPGDEDEVIEVCELSRAEVEAAIRNGIMKDGKSISVYARALLSGLL